MITLNIGDIVKYREPFTDIRITCQVTNIYDGNGHSFMRFDGRVIDSSAFIDSEYCSDTIYSIYRVNGKDL